MSDNDGRVSAVHRVTAAVVLSAFTPVLTLGLSTAPAYAADPGSGLQSVPPPRFLPGCHGSVAGAEVPEPVRPPEPRPSPTRTTPPPSPSPTATPLKPYVVRINSGGAAVKDGGLSWSADRWFTGGTVSRSAAAITSATPNVDADERWGLTGYSIPVPRNATYRVRIHVTETSQPSGGYRIFDISAEGSVIGAAVDPFVLAGGQNITKVLEYRVTVKDRRLDLTFTPAATALHPNPSVSAIEVLSGR